MEERDEKIHELEERLRPAEEERALFRQQAGELKETNEALRRALSMKICGKIDNSGVLGTWVDGRHHYIMTPRPHDIMTCVGLTTVSTVSTTVC